jgi:predicted nucleic acid-binding protein
VPSIQVKDVPADVHAVLRKRAANNGMSLQEYLLAHLVEEASTPTLDEVLDRAGGRSGGSVLLDVAVAAYVALAELLRCPLVTGDARLSRASGVRCPIDVM